MGNFAEFLGSVGKSIFGGAVGTLGDIATGAINRQYQKEQYAQEVKDEQSRYNRNRKDYLEDLAKEKQYNSASSQLERLRYAGLNPNLMGSSSLSAGQSSIAQPMGSHLGPTSQSAQVGSALGSGMISTSLNDSIRKLNDARSAEAFAVANVQSELALSEKEFRPIRKALVRAQAAEAEGHTKLMNEQANQALELAIEAASRRRGYDIDNETRGLMNRAMIAKVRSETALTDQEKVVQGLIASYRETENKWQKVNYWIDAIFRSSFVISNVAGSFSGIWRLFKKEASHLTVPDSNESLIVYLEKMYPDMISNQPPLTLPPAR